VYKRFTNSSLSVAPLSIISRTIIKGLATPGYPKKEIISIANLKERISNCTVPIIVGAIFHTNIEGISTKLSHVFAR